MYAAAIISYRWFSDAFSYMGSIVEITDISIYRYILNSIGRAIHNSFSPIGGIRFSLHILRVLVRGDIKFISKNIIFTEVPILCYPTHYDDSTEGAEY